ncbi:hypothetical protein SAMN05216420_103215 [Nitrosospira sp. Nl5]|uniref:hypothetical protein n=1 Tax=Nitrosospira sp. Nl5 TaxID=200120 RepID=UPI00087DFD0C|nr:hypothetical protein [Nitrosospira sp. Nl5]SCY21684.1 hypothetical protein SAMN05216420_103215 [Nitrosospira sp. Nl5]
MKLPFSIQLAPLPPMRRTAAKAGGTLQGRAPLPGGARDADLTAAANQPVQPVRTGSAFRNPAVNISGYLQALADDKPRHSQAPLHARPGKKRFG